MAATPHHHRKLIQPPTNTTTISHFCIFECDPQLNPTGVCSADCISFCPPFCNTTSSSPTPSPATAPYSFPPPYHHPHPPLPLPLKISLIFLLVTFIYTLYKFYSVCHRSRPHPTSPENQESLDLQIHHLDDDGVGFGGVDHPIWYIRTTGLNPSVINSLAIVKFSKTDTSIEVTDCSVCLSEFEEDDVLRLLPNCKHAFHISCIDTWLRSHTNCPLCRAIIVNNVDDPPESEENRSDLGFVREISLGVSSIRDVDVDQGSASGSSGLRIGGIGGIDEDDVNNSNKQQ